MKLTLTSFLLAVALLTVAIAVPTRVEAPMQKIELDADGLTALRVEGDVDVRIKFGSQCDCGPHVEWPSDGEGDVAVHRDGEALTLTATGMDGGTVDVVLADGVRDIDIPRGSVRAEQRQAAIQIRAQRAVDWSGDADSLDLLVTGGSDDCPEDSYCDTQVEVQGEIGELRVQAQSGTIALWRPQDIGHALVRLTSDVELTIHDATRLDNVSIEHLDPTPTD